MAKVKEDKAAKEDPEKQALQTLSSRNPATDAACRPELSSMVDRKASGTQEQFNAISTAFGSSSVPVVNRVMTQIANLSAPRTALVSGEDIAPDVNSAIAFMAAVAPADECQTALAVQMLGTHELSVTMLMRAKQNIESGHREAAEAYANMATKLSRTFVAQMEALAKLRSAGKQVIEVQHVHVYPGGQAVVGDVHQSNGGSNGRG